jgi:hypothetical protein
MTKIIPVELITQKIIIIRGHKVIIDKDLAALYRVKPIALRQQVKRNIKRFPQDFMFKLTNQEADILVSQNVIPSKQNLGGHLPYVFTEQGVAMLSSVLKSERAIEVNIIIMRAFVKLRELISSHKDLAAKFDELEKKYDEQFVMVFKILRQMAIPLDSGQKANKKIGFIAKAKNIEPK